jgi:hypothetical protein
VSQDQSKLSYPAAAASVTSTLSPVSVDKTVGDNDDNGNDNSSSQDKINDE